MNSAFTSGFQNNLHLIITTHVDPTWRTTFYTTMGQQSTRVSSTTARALSVKVILSSLDLANGQTPLVSSIPIVPSCLPAHCRSPEQRLTTRGDTSQPLDHQ